MKFVLVVGGMLFLIALLGIWGAIGAIILGVLALGALAD